MRAAVVEVTGDKSNNGHDYDDDDDDDDNKWGHVSALHQRREYFSSTLSSASNLHAFPVVVKRAPLLHKVATPWASIWSTN